MEIRSSGPIKTSNAVADKAKSVAGKIEFKNVLGKSKVIEILSSAKIDEIMAGLNDLSTQVKSGHMAKEAATRKFVSLVVQQLNLTKHSKNAEKIAAIIADSVEQDPNFTKKLEEQLKRL
ncbi:MAG: hypothetical protein O2897_01810 [bacterium]|nr:hypothetical protein [bacterium]